MKSFPRTADALAKINLSGLIIHTERSVTAVVYHQQNMHSIAFFVVVVFSPELHGKFSPLTLLFYKITMNF